MAGCGTINKMEYYDEVSSTSLTHEALGGIPLHSKESEVMNSFGEPDLTRESEENNIHYLIYGKGENKDNIEFKIQDQLVERINLSTGQYTTNKQVKVGDGKKKVIEAYGENFYEREDTGAEILGYFDKEGKINLEFTLADSKVAGIIIEAVNE
jgi:hypothetical protein